MVEPKTRKLTSKDAIIELWNRAELSYKLRGKQIEIYNDFRDSSDKTHVICCSRRYGKSFILFLIAVEECLRNPDTIIKYIAPTKGMVEEILSIVSKKLLDDCPNSLRPEWKEKKQHYAFHNGSQIQIAATENNNIEKIRGGECKIGIVDEAAFTTDLEYAIKNVLRPATLTTKGRIILSSTPNFKKPNHPFNVEYLLPREREGTLKKFTIYDAPFIDQSEIPDIIEEYGGEDSAEFRCEFLAEVVVDVETMVFPEFQGDKSEILIGECPLPKFFDTYVSMDIGFKDLTVVLFAYYDYLKETTVVLDELVINGPQLTTEYLATEIQRIEQMYFIDSNNFDIKPSKRVADNNNPILLNDLFRLHGIQFLPTAKDNKRAQVNEVKLRMRKSHILIHPRCVNLIYHCKMAQWKSNKNGILDQFERIRANKNKKLLASHADGVDALVYLIRNVSTIKNPYPDNYFNLTGEGVHTRAKVKDTVTNFMHSLMNYKGKGK